MEIETIRLICWSEECIIIDKDTKLLKRFLHQLHSSLSSSGTQRIAELNPVLGHYLNSESSLSRKSSKACWPSHLIKLDMEQLISSLFTSTVQSSTSTSTSPPCSKCARPSTDFYSESSQTGPVFVIIKQRRLACSLSRKEVIV